MSNLQKSGDVGLLNVERAVAALAACVNVDGAKEIKDKAIAVRDYWKRQRGAGGEAAANAARIVAHADLRMGQLLKTEPKAPAGRHAKSVPAKDQLPKEKGWGHNPAEGPMHRTPTPTLAERGVSKNESSRLQKIATKAEADPVFAKAFVEQQAAKAAKFVGRAPGTTDDPSHDAATADAWETPDHILELARNVLGDIDTDPASNPHAQKRVKAATHYTAKDSGLDHEWHGNVFCNPPYSMPLIGQFTDKLIAEFNAGRVKQAIYLVDNNTDAGWFQTLARACSAICFPRGRIPFVSPLGHPSAPRRGQAIFYLGKRVALFRDTFGAIDVGTVFQVMGAAEKKSNAA